MTRAGASALRAVAAGAFRAGVWARTKPVPAAHTAATVNMTSRRIVNRLHHGEAAIGLPETPVANRRMMSDHPQFRRPDDSLEATVRANRSRSAGVFMALLCLAACQTRSEGAASEQPQAGGRVAPSLAKAKLTEATAAAKAWNPDAFNGIWGSHL